MICVYDIKSHDVYFENKQIEKVFGHHRTVINIIIPVHVIICFLSFFGGAKGILANEAVFPRTLFLWQSRFVAESKLNSVAKFLCQISVTKLSELSSLSNLCCL